MLRPSTAPRWKIATRIFCRACAACAARAMNAGAKPRLTSARLPFLRKMRRVIMACSRLTSLEFRRSERAGPRVCVYRSETPAIRASSATAAAASSARASVWRVASDASPAEQRCDPPGRATPRSCRARAPRTSTWIGPRAELSAGPLAAARLRRPADAPAVGRLGWPAAGPLLAAASAARRRARLRRCVRRRAAARRSSCG